MACHNVILIMTRAVKEKTKMKKYIFKDNINPNITKEVTGWGYNMLPSGDYIIYNSCFYDRNPIIKARDFYLAKVEVL